MVTKALAGIDLHTSSNESQIPHPSNGNNAKGDKPTPRNPSSERRYKRRRNRLENFRAWREHLRRPVQERGPESLTSTKSWAAIPSWFRRSNYVPGRKDNMTIKAPKKPPHIFPLGNPRDVFENENDDETNPWLETKFSDFMGTTTEPGYTKWKGKRILGQGGQGRVGLWEYNGEDPNFPKNVAVKEAFSSWGKKENAWLDHEVKYLLRLDPIDTEHILKTVQKPILKHLTADQLQYSLDSDDSTKAVDTDGVTYVSHYTRVLLEYCDMGDLGLLLMRRRRMAKRFYETTLWEFFDCLVDGCTVLAYGAEYDKDARNNPIEKFTETHKDWAPIMHLDFKPGNIFVGEVNAATHGLPILKESCPIGDFGCAYDAEPYPPDDAPPEIIEDHQIYLRQLVNVGTFGYRNPEQTTRFWGYKNWYQTRIAGNYGPWTNLWSAALLVYKLMTLETGSGYSTQPPIFQPDFLINGKPAKGPTYGKNLPAYDGLYSSELRDLMYECMYENPAHRPSIWEVKKRISEGLENARDAADEADIKTEPLKDFEPRRRPKSTKKRKKPYTVVFAVSKSKSKDSLPSPSSSSSFEPEWTKPEFGLGLGKRPDKPEVADSEEVSTSESEEDSGPESDEDSGSESEEKGKVSRRDSDSSLKGSTSYTRFLKKGQGSPRVDSKRGKYSTDLDEAVEPTSRMSQKTTSGTPIRKSFGGKRSDGSDGEDFISPRPETPSWTPSSGPMSSPGPAIFRKSTPHPQTTPFGKDTRKDDDGKSQVVVITSRSNPRTSTARSTPKYISEKPKTSSKVQVKLATEKRTGRLVEIIFNVFHIEGPVGEERILPQMPIVVGNLNSTSTVMDLKQAIRDATRFDENRLEIEDMHFVITSLPTKRRPLEDMDNTTFEELGINGLTYPHVHINMKNEPEQEVGSGPARYGLMINVALRSARSDKWLLEFRGLNETTRLRNLKQRVATVAKIAVANQVWLYGDRRLGDKDSGLQLRDIVRGDGATFAVWTKNPNEKIFVDYSIPGVSRGPSRIQRGVDFGTQTPAPDQRLPTRPIPGQFTPPRSSSPSPRTPTPPSPRWSSSKKTPPIGQTAGDYPEASSEDDDDRYLPSFTFIKNVPSHVRNLPANLRGAPEAVREFAEEVRSIVMIDVETVTEFVDDVRRDLCHVS
ncbi:hypothetical protein HYFRA_00000203 [Hymenoscyphus fraxineus]|uniref:Protein kinase domain-containing protein n=1 Tax=Hymenoscyphus fraxineus TaxID=746836 RepID=A0A9N9PWJ7_9HELO|nr:hypothetical protein HYFRA_00000203 [Hymenoscyphus fraxineus]